MFKRVLQRCVKNYCFLITCFLFSHSALAENIELVVKDQYGQQLADAVVELEQINKPYSLAPRSVAIMDQVHKQFLPELLIVQKGQRVNFPNSDNIRHHVYSFSQAKPFQLKLYSGQPKDPITFEQQGVVVLGCNIHDSMVGYIYVASSERVYKTDKQGRIELPLNDFPLQISVWHPLQTESLESKKIITINDKSDLVVTINTSSPSPRNTFGSKFKAGND
ncbi:methylamine utilization protein [Pseudoalteromonas sp. SG45-5]|uniref:methylamine utilization protein n=1 Tax=unclassified Pseudoalteromonas TaxID=194690 RepID=UPI0015FBCCE4|nr:MULTISPECIES: methylamine utilization protein [unclassified Pseudoalteromonas]MBB1385014.1 methylamine utilization protein [Pseudoalteromonas sp. SG45-5]MBB1392939.1 methylamine utilization protein [Pseudoalteromonas sp. SG44-4]MBB1445971.1 methylamine utilization protein [Pseudoalteromonas sp. SG41-6]